eukprot:scaffold206478_cov33-Tisochrysis_lutea.AAC.8
MANDPPARPPTRRREVGEVSTGIDVSRPCPWQGAGWDQMNDASGLIIGPGATYEKVQHEPHSHLDRACAAVEVGAAPPPIAPAPLMAPGRIAALLQ